MEKKKNTIIALLIVVIIILIILCIIFAVRKDDTNKTVTQNIFNDILGTYVKTSYSDACGTHKLSLEFKEDNKASVVIEDECTGNTNATGTYSVTENKIYIIYDEPSAGEGGESNSAVFEYKYDNSKLTIYSNNEELTKE